MEINCNTCDICIDMCIMLNDYDFCKDNGYALWSPRDHSVCVGCQFYDSKNDRCTRLAESCEKNTTFASYVSHKTTIWTQELGVEKK